LTDDSQTVLTFTTFDPGTLTSSGRLVPSSYLPDSIVASLYFKANTTSQAESVHAFSEEWFDGMLKVKFSYANFVSMSNKNAQPPFCLGPLHMLCYLYLCT